jgi:hypothetical protein
MLSDNWQAGKGGGSGPELCGEMFADPSLSLPRVIGSKEVAAVFATANKMRNDWSGHGGVVGQDEARLRNQRLLAEVQNLREACGSLFNEMELMYALHCRPRRGSFENEVAVLAGSNSEFLKESREMAMFLDVESLYLGRKGSARALRLLPLVQVGSSPSSAKNACYFFNRLDRDGARFISYHHADTPEQSGSFPEAIEAIRTLTEV